MNLKTTKVRLRASKLGACIIINERDFDPAKHARLDEPQSAPVAIEAQPVAEPLADVVDEVEAVSRPRSRRR